MRGASRRACALCECVDGLPVAGDGHARHAEPTTRRSTTDDSMEMLMGVRELAVAGATPFDDDFKEASATTRHMFDEHHFPLRCAPRSSANR